MELFSLFLSQTVQYCYIEKLLIFVYLFHILLICWKCLSDLELLVESLGSFKYKFIWSVNRDNLISFFPVCIPFVTFSCLIALARNFSTILNKSGESGHSCLLPDFRGNDFSFSLCSVMLATGLSYIAFRRKLSSGWGGQLYDCHTECYWPRAGCNVSSCTDINGGRCQSVNRGNLGGTVDVGIDRWDNDKT
jgi:hypothetical protein